MQEPRKKATETCNNCRVPDDSGAGAPSGELQTPTHTEVGRGGVGPNEAKNRWDRTAPLPRWQARTLPRWRLRTARWEPE